MFMELRNKNLEGSKCHCNQEPISFHFFFLHMDDLHLKKRKSKEIKDQGHEQKTFA